MLTVYYRNGDLLIPVEPATQITDDLLQKSLWIDLVNPTAEEESQVEKWANIPIPTREDMGEIEESSRFYSENGAQYLTAPFLHLAEDDHRIVSPVTFILTDKLLISVRYAQPKSFVLYVARTAKSGNGLINSRTNSLCVLLGIIETNTNRLADFIEGVSEKIDNASHRIYRRPDNKRPMSTQNFREILNEIGAHGTFLSRMRESLSGIRRLLVYITANSSPKTQAKDTRAWLKTLERDTQSLENYVDFLNNKINFLLDTIVGLISVEQNAIIKIFSVAAVGFMPPTLIASIYGMNFSFMPELSEKWGYPAALGLMVISALIPLYFFRRKGWL
ncbi:MULTISPECIES: magnesium/cobalt transporter CorA [Pseudochrobactrum]|uniref:Magnesium transport protein CorA n=1 Tax=Pseudochrobactrum saccharolyticum TaxID=354352 RepID=A0A7W8AHW2_9HYPH|nr:MULTISPECIES: magnesium/cobalt transporter CorA [Pseudochrobactrum]KAB0540076.1 magnesium/cobalt transporter CorA [Pseudochrobactrum saccharolyticum]MBB5089561.1 magnesium transporter [Pseudochrobactrum saccharolyticum]MDP8251448.1 magnesium/cobalt transporter CorA [Pseudochrobactrum saccharolyticum]QYM72702.1 magnesium/cobalt transporter CorA [Pseudochrobactrum sp. Wa41.01b-1]UCA46410.1 magnesium/cobalt transporter CorA [Pseudochrobactrum sp. XF203]